MTVPGRHTLVLIGAGGHALVVLEAALAMGFTVAGYFDDAEHPALAKHSGSGVRLGGLADASVGAHEAHMALGDLEARRRVIGAHRSMRWIRIVHPAAIVSPSAELEQGSFIGAGAIVQTRARIGRHCILNTGCIVEHECEISENVHVAPRATLCGRVCVGRDTLIGAGAIVLPGVRIGAHSIVGAGAMVREDVPEGACVVGVPARALASNPHHPKHIH